MNRQQKEEVSPKDVFLNSLERCSSEDGFLEEFYDRFVLSSDAIRAKFANTDMYLQKQMLLRSLKLSAGATAGDTEALAEIHDRAESHSRHRLNIEPPLYDYWLSAMLAAAAKFDPVWDDEIEAAWKRILGHVVRTMVKKY